MDLTEALRISREAHVAATVFAPTNFPPWQWTYNLYKLHPKSRKPKVGDRMHMVSDGVARRYADRYRGNAPCVGWVFEVKRGKVVVRL